PPPLPPAPTTLSLHDALPISTHRRRRPPARRRRLRQDVRVWSRFDLPPGCLNGSPHSPDNATAGGDAPARRNRRPPYPGWGTPLDRKSTRLNSSHVSISYAVF